MRIARRHVFVLLPLGPLAVVLFAGCSAAPSPDAEAEGEDSAPLSGQCAGSSGAACAGKPIDRAVRCAVAKGARVLSYYRSPAQQECVRRQNHCTDRCSGSAGCDRPTAGCTTSPHSRCHAVDLVNDGAPVSRAQLRACGLAKTTAPHANHYDLLDGVQPDMGIAQAGSSKSSPSDAPADDPGTVPVPVPRPSDLGGCHSFTLGKTVAAGTCVQRDDDGLWYVCDGADPTAWPSVADPLDPQCTSCPQLPGGRCE